MALQDFANASYLLGSSPLILPLSLSLSPSLVLLARLLALTHHGPSHACTFHPRTMLELFFTMANSVHGQRILSEMAPFARFRQRKTRKEAGEISRMSLILVIVSLRFAPSGHVTEKCDGFPPICHWLCAISVHLPMRALLLVLRP